MKRELRGIVENLESAIRVLSEPDHPSLNAIVERDLKPAKEKAEYLESIAL